MSRRPATTLPRTVPAGQLRRTLEAVQRFRANFVFGSLLVLFALLLLRLGKLQLVEASHYRSVADRNHAARIVFAPVRGRLLDVHGRVLATGRRVLWVGVDPRPGIVEDVPTFARRLADVLDDESLGPVIAARIEAERGREKVRGGVCILPCVEERRIVDRLDELRRPGVARAVGLYGLLVEDREKRFYPDGSYAAHVLGEACEDPSPGAGTGVEAYLDHVLAGERVAATARRDGRQRLLVAERIDRRRLRGDDVRLTLDVVVQHFLETALDRLEAEWGLQGEDRKAWSCAGIVLAPDSGEVVALAARPTFDPNRERAVFNPAVSGLYEPGSAFKPFTVAQALSIGVVLPDQVISMPSVWSFAGDPRPVTDSHPVGDGDVTLLLAESSNVGAAQLAHLLGAAGMRALFERLVLDGPTGIELPGEKPGFLAEPRLPTGALVRSGYGQGFAVTPIQLAAWYAGLAREDGRVVKPTLLPGRGGPREDLPPLASAEHLAVVRRGLEGCVDTGTAADAFEGARWAAAGKTGTAQRMGTPYLNCSFCGYAPRERPRVVVLVMATVRRDEERRASGGRVAAPAVRDVLERTLEYWKVPATSPAPEAR